MNRKERREKARQEKKSNDKKAEAIRWVNSLPSEKFKLIQSYANMIAKRDNDTFIDALQRCYSAAIIDQIENIEFAKVEQIIEEFAYLMKEDADKMNKLKEECGGNLEMAVKKVNEKEKDVLELVTSLINQGKKQKEAIEILIAEFPMLSKAMLTNAYKKTKADLKETLKSEEKANEIQEQTAEPAKEEVKKIAAKEIIEEDPTEDFEIINKTIDLRGKYGTYHIEKNVLTIDEMLAFQNADEVREWAKEERARIVKLIEEVSRQEDEALKVMKKFM